MNQIIIRRPRNYTIKFKEVIKGKYRKIPIKLMTNTWFNLKPRSQSGSSTQLQRPLWKTTSLKLDLKKCT